MMTFDEPLIFYYSVAACGDPNPECQVIGVRCDHANLELEVPSLQPQEVAEWMASGASAVIEGVGAPLAFRLVSLVITDFDGLWTAGLDEADRRSRPHYWLRELQQSSAASLSFTTSSGRVLTLRLSADDKANFAAFADRCLGLQ